MKRFPQSDNAFAGEVVNNQAIVAWREAGVPRVVSSNPSAKRESHDQLRQDLPFVLLVLKEICLFFEQLKHVMNYN